MHCELSVDALNTYSQPFETRHSEAGARCDAEWYHGAMSREDCQRVMAPVETGKFLVRDSVTKRGRFALSICAPPNAYGTILIKHYLIRLYCVPLDDGVNGAIHVGIHERVLFNNLEQLISYYRSGANGLACRLSKPVSRFPSDVEMDDDYIMWSDVDKSLVALVQVPSVRNVPSQIGSAISMHSIDTVSTSSSLSLNSLDQVEPTFEEPAAKRRRRDDFI